MGEGRGATGRGGPATDELREEVDLGAKEGIGDSPAPRDLRSLPGVDRVMEALGTGAPASLVAEAAREAVDSARRRLQSGGGEDSFDAITVDARARLDSRLRSLLGPVINATGVLIHTNLGRVPLGVKQLEAVTRVAGGYSNLEYDLGTGRRSSRYAHASRLLKALMGAEAALVVNNNAAAVLLVMTALCHGREVVISRGELVEIGGEFRIPDVMAASGARLKEVGTTNRTRLADYERAISPDSAAILKVHPSNYRMEGFVASVSARELAKLARGRGIPLVYDIGSGLVKPPDAPWLGPEPAGDAAVAEGCDIVTFSGDKLLGGPQAGVVAGRQELIARLARHPLMRALRVDKMTLAALEATLIAHLEGRREDLPVWQMALASAEDLEARARRITLDLVHQLTPDVKVEAVPSRSVAGGGSLPGAELGSWAVHVDDPEHSADETARALRASSPPVIGRIEEGRLLLDVRTIAPREDAALIAAVVQAMGR